MFSSAGADLQETLRLKTLITVKHIIYLIYLRIINFIRIMNERKANEEIDFKYIFLKEDAYLVSTGCSFDILAPQEDLCP